MISTLFREAIYIRLPDDIHNNLQLCMHSRKMQFNRSVGFVWLIYNLGETEIADYYT